MFKLRIASIFLALCTACGADDKSTKEPTHKLNGQEYVVIGEDNLKKEESFLEGSGKIAFLDPIGEIKSEKLYKLQFELTAENSKLALLSHTDKKLEKGVEISVELSNGKVQAKVSLEGQVQKQNTFEVSIQNPIKVNIEVHNAEGDSSSHIIVILDGITSEDDMDDLNRTYSTTTTGQGLGTYWGLNLQNAKVLSAVAEEAEHRH